MSFHSFKPIGITGFGYLSNLKASERQWLSKKQIFSRFAGTFGELHAIQPHQNTR